MIQKYVSGMYVVASNVLVFAVAMFSLAQLEVIKHSITGRVEVSSSYRTGQNKQPNYIAVIRR